MLRSDDTYVFGDFRLDLAEKVLLRDGKAVPLTPKVFETLQLFVENAGHLIEKDELMRKLWQDRFVEESNLTFNIKMLRKALGDNASKPKFIETVQRRGYRFIAETQLIEKEDNENGSSAVSTSQRRSAMRPLHPLIQKAAVVALAEWKNGASPAPPEASPLTTAELKLVPASPVARVGSKHLLLVMAGLLLGAIGLGYYLLYSRGAEAIDSVAILPFVNASGDNNTDYLSEAISDSIINSLSRLPNLKVNSLNSVMRYKGKDVDAQEVGRELNVRAVLISKFTQTGDDLTITTELVDVTDKRRLWGGQYTRKLSDILVVQGEIARQISEGLRMRLTGEEEKLLAKQPTRNSDAHLHYSLGKYYFRQYTKEAFEKSIESFNDAIKIDPEYALAYAGLAGTYQFMMSRGFLPPEEYVQKVEWAALKAVHLDGTLAESHAALGGYKLIKYDWAGAETEIKRALELDPGSSVANGYFGTYLTAVGQTDEALRFTVLARTLDPAPDPGEAAFAYYMARQYEKAIELYRNNLERKPNNAHARILLGEALLANGAAAEGVLEMEKGMSLDTALAKTPERWDRYPLLAYAYATAGHRNEALRILEEQQSLAKRQYVSPYNFAIIYTGLGDKDQAFEWLTKCVEQEVLIIFHLKSRSLFDSLRSDPRYPELLSKMNLSP